MAAAAMVTMGEAGAAVVAVAMAVSCTIPVTGATAHTVVMGTAAAVADCCTGYTIGEGIGSPASAMVVMVDVGAEAVTAEDT